MNTLQLAEYFRLSHHSVITLILNKKDDFNKISDLSLLSKTAKSSGRPTAYYELTNEQVLLYLFLMKTDKRTVESKLQLCKSLILNKSYQLNFIDCANHKTGHLYIIENKSNGLIKIGVSNNPERRIRTLETHTGITLSNIFVSENIKEYQSHEKKMHHIFKECRIKGEWFDVGFDHAVITYNNLLT